MSIKYLALVLLVAGNCSADEGRDSRNIGRSHTISREGQEKYQLYQERLEADKEELRQQEQERLAKQAEEESQETSETPQEVLESQARTYENERLAGGLTSTAVGAVIFYSLCNDADPSLVKVAIKVTAAGVLMGIGSMETYLVVRDKIVKKTS